MNVLTSSQGSFPVIILEHDKKGKRKKNDQRFSVDEIGLDLFDGDAE